MIRANATTIEKMNLLKKQYGARSLDELLQFLIEENLDREADVDGQHTDA